MYPKKTLKPLYPKSKANCRDDSWNPYIPAVFFLFLDRGSHQSFATEEPLRKQSCHLRAPLENHHQQMLNGAGLVTYKTGGSFWG